MWQCRLGINVCLFSFIALNDNRLWCLFRYIWEKKIFWCQCHSVKHLCFMLKVDCTCNYAPLQVFRNVQKPTIRSRNRFQPREKTFIIIPTFESECLGFFKCGNIWKNEDFVLHKSLLFNWELTMQHHSYKWRKKNTSNVQHFIQWRNHMCPLHHWISSSSNRSSKSVEKKA